MLLGAASLDRAPGASVRCALLGVLLLGATSCGGGTALPSTPDLLPTTPEVHVLAATIVPTTDGDAIVSFSAHNAGAEPDTLIDASCVCAESAQIVGGGEIGAQETGLFGPNGDHVLLRGFDEGLAPGDFADVTLVFANAEEVITPAEVADA